MQPPSCSATVHRLEDVLKINYFPASFCLETVPPHPRASHRSPPTSSGAAAPGEARQGSCLLNSRTGNCGLDLEQQAEMLQCCQEPPAPMADAGYSKWHFPAAASLEREAFKRSPAEEQPWPGLEVVGEEFSFHLEILSVSGCQERTPHNRPVQEGNVQQCFGSLQRPIQHPQLGQRTTYWYSRYLGNPQRHCTLCPGTSNHVWSP